MTLTLVSPQDTRGRVSSRWVSVADRQVEVFTIDGVEYVRGEPADVEIRSKGFSTSMLLRRRDSIARANALCSLHPRYRGVRKPRTSCPQCRAAYEAAHNDKEAVQ